MNDIITDFIGKQITKRLALNQPISMATKNQQANKHIIKCKKQICPECSKILKGDNK